MGTEITGLDHPTPFFSSNVIGVMLIPIESTLRTPAICPSLAQYLSRFKIPRSNVFGELELKRFVKIWQESSFSIIAWILEKWSSCTTHHACGVVAPRLIPRQVQRLHQRRFGCSRPGMFNCMQLYKQLYIPRWFPNGRWWALYLSPQLTYQVSSQYNACFALVSPEDNFQKKFLSFQSSFPNENYQGGLAKVDGRLW